MATIIITTWPIVVVAVLLYILSLFCIALPSPHFTLSDYAGGDGDGDVRVEKTLFWISLYLPIIIMIATYSFTIKPCGYYSEFSNIIFWLALALL